MGSEDVAGDVHAASCGIEVGFPAADVEEAESLKAELKSAFVAYELSHEVFVGLDFFEIRVTVVGTDTCALAYGLDDVVG